MLQRTVEAALAAFKLPQLNQDTVTDGYKQGGVIRRKYQSINSGEKPNKHFKMTWKLAKGYIFVWSRGASSNSSKICKATNRGHWELWHNWKIVGQLTNYKKQEKKYCCNKTVFIDLPACTNVAASSSLHFCLSLVFFTFITQACIIYGRIFLNIGKLQGLKKVLLETITADNMFWLPSQTKRHHKWCDWTKLRGRRARITANLTQLGPKATPLPSQLMTSVLLQENKTEEISLRLNQQQKIRDCCAHIFEETWLYTTPIQS